MVTAAFMTHIEYLLQAFVRMVCDRTSVRLSASRIAVFGTVIASYE